MSFPITCTACHKTFTISDEIYEKKVSGRVVTIKCKSCGQGIRVDGTQGGAAAAAPAGAAAPAAAGPAAPTELVWAVDYPDGQDREFTTAEVVAELQRGAINGTTLVWRDGMAEWLELARVSEFAADWTKQEAKLKAEAAAKEAAAKEAAAKAAAAAKEAAAKPAPVHKPRAPMPTAVGLAGLPGVGATKPRAQQPSTPELPKPRAQQPSTPELPKPRAQQPSTPELPKPRAQQPSTPELPKPRAQQASSPVLPKPPAPPPPLAAPEPATPVAAPVVAAPPPLAPPAPAPPPIAAPLPLPPEPKAPDVTPPLPASVAKVVSRPPQEVVPAFPSAPAVPNMASFGAAPAVVADHASVEWPESKKKTPLIIGGVVAALVVIGGGVALLTGKEEAPPPSTPIAAAPAPLPAPAPAPTPTPSPSPATTAQLGADTASGSDPVATAPDQGTTPGAGFAEMFAAGARKAESKGATVAPSARFDAAATKVPLAQAANEAQACKQSGGPTGKVTVVVTFDPNGKVSSATITEAPFAGTPTGACIAQTMKRASIGAFSGLPGTVSKTFSIL
ncbi:MAG TPA: GYF domain-containing protein [Polyangiaceae bacterium]|nr:GYF domain-containing protein [Polyangiaceae bacterium]